MGQNPTELTVKTPDETTTVEDVKTWWYDNHDLIVVKQDGEEKPFPCGIIL